MPPGEGQRPRLGSAVHRRWLPPQGGAPGAHSEAERELEPHAGLKVPVSVHAASMSPNLEVRAKVRLGSAEHWMASGMDTQKGGPGLGPGALHLEVRLRKGPANRTERTSSRRQEKEQHDEVFWKPNEEN